jgi:hypothetical protein
MHVQLQHGTETEYGNRCGDGLAGVPAHGVYNKPSVCGVLEYSCNSGGGAT